ncbi:MAG: M48 family metalloprotease [Sphingopyxis sp.]
MIARLSVGRRALLLAARAIIGLLVTASLSTAPLHAQSILRDAETESLLADMSEPLIRAAGLQPADVRIVLVGDRSINAFVAGGQIVYIHSGLLEASDNANQVQGVIAHELGHVAGGHAVHNAGASKASTIAILSLLLGGLAVAAGAGEAGTGIMAAGQQAALGSYLAFSRVQEATADAAGARYLSAAGVSGKGSVEFFQKLLSQELRYNIPQDDDQAYGRTHPMSGDRIRFLRDSYSADPAWDTVTSPEMEARFQRVKAKLGGFVNDPQQTLRRFPAADQSTAALYARAYAWHKSGHPDQAISTVNALVATAPDDPYFQELQGQVLLESCRPVDALVPLRAAVARTNAQPLIAALFGHALIATEDESHYAEAEAVLRAAVNRDNDNPFAWYQLGIIYAHRGDNARAALATAERYSLTGQSGLALNSAEQAMAGLDATTPDWLRAQDIALVARAGLEEERRRARQNPDRR